MKVLVIALVLALVAAPKAAAVELKPPLQLKPKAALVTQMAAPAHNYAPSSFPATSRCSTALPR